MPMSIKIEVFFIETEGLSYTINEPSVQDEESVNRIKEELYEK